MTSKKCGETLPNNVSQPGPSQKTNSQDKHKRDEECRKENLVQKEANNSNDNKTEKAVGKKKMTYRVLEVKDPAMMAQIECLKILKSLGAEIPANAADFLDLDESRKIFVIEAEDSGNESENRSTHDTDQERIRSLIFGRSENDEDKVKKPEDSNKD